MKRADLQSQQGFTALEMLVVLIVTVAALGLGAQYASNYADTLANQSSAEHQKTVSDAAVRYIKDNYAALLDAAGPTTPATVTVSMLKNTGYLPASFIEQNPFGQDYKILVLRPTEQKLETLIVSTGGETIPEMSIRRIAQLIGAHGGFISSIDATKVQGSYGGWQVSLSSYGESPGAGHLATALFFEDGALISDYLYRSAVGGHPELNQMNTAIDMAGNDINNGGQVNANTVKVTGNITAGGNISATGDASAANANIRGDTTTGAWFRTTGDGGWYSQKWNGGWYMNDPDWVRSYADKNVYTGGQVQAGMVNANTVNATGHITAGGNISAAGDASAANASIRGDTTTGNWFRTTGDGGWYSQKWNGGWYMNDPEWVRSYADKNVYTAGQVLAGTVNATGPITAGGNISAAGDASATNANIRGDTTTGGWFRTTGDGGWHSQKWNGGWYMSDPEWVRSYADKNVYTGGQVRAGTVNANGRLSTGEFLQLNGVANLGWGCSPNGLVGRDGNGLLLSCQSGIWRKQGGGFSGWQQVGNSGYAPHSGILVATSCFNCKLVGYASGIQRFAISERDRYGQGFVSGTMPVMRGEAWQFSGAQTVWLMSFED